MLIFSTNFGLAAPEAIAYSGGALISELISELAQVRRWRNRLPRVRSPSFPQGIDYDFPCVSWLYLPNPA
ncbi:hypothetical protein [Nostoc parmelioides]|uniref:Uncharacterized protein n=1 Tax=Nostoc parmelioides FACHB-3921 TaxID=2692909 RepID=A0ABR8BMH6_9NOSO|nr:hypothetical protein [Nostoc parmelioides]MBD2254760.1 hypothetical protein [Nostoc parmelioides FACHB-3921]